MRCRCGKPISGDYVHVTAAGQHLCPGCDETVSRAELGLMSGGGTTAAVAAPGVLDWLRRALRLTPRR